MSDKPAVMAVRVVDLDVPFWQLVWLLLKLALAAIPALLILTVYSVVLFAIVGGLMRG